MALGWVGDATDFDLLSARVRTDGSTECRVVAVGALVQLLERHPGEVSRATAEMVLRVAIDKDRDPLVRDAAAEALQQIRELNQLLVLGGELGSARTVQGWMTAHSEHPGATPH